MKLYHGSNIAFESIDLTKSRPNKDFGQGFYLTESKEQAQRMAEQKVLLFGGHTIVMAYELDETCLNNESLAIKKFDNYTEEWAEFVLLNRNRKSKAKLHNYDIVIGPIADDKVGVQLFRYMKEYIDLTTLVKKLQYIEITIQYYFGTERAVNLLKRL
jgi:hypothetical protein